MSQSTFRRWKRPRQAKSLPLFDAPKRSPVDDELPPHRGVATSVAAARAVAPRTRTQRQVVLAAIAARGTAGATFDELVVELGMAINVVSPRVGELRKAGLVADSGQKRQTRTGCLAIVWALGEPMAACSLAATASGPPGVQTRPAAVPRSAAEPYRSSPAPAGDEDTCGDADRAAPGPASRHCGQAQRPLDISTPPTIDGNQSQGGHGCQPRAN